MSARDKSVEAIAILINSRAATLRKMPAMDYLGLTEKLAFASSMPDSKFDERIRIGDVEFGFIPDLTALTVAEIIDLESYSVNWDKDLSKLMAILYRPITKISTDGSYDVEQYGASRADLRAKLFETEMSAQDAYGASLFFSLIVATCLASSHRSSDQHSLASRMMTT